MTNSKKLMAPGIAALLITAGCGVWPTTSSETTGDTFGDAVRDVMNSQIHDYDAAINPDPDAIEGSDPDRLNNVVEAYREHISKPEEVQTPIQISVGGN